MSKTNGNGQQEFTTEVLHTLPLKLHNAESGSVDLVKQCRRRKDSDRFGRPFLCVQIKTRRMLFLDPDVARQLHAALGDIIPKLDAIETQMKTEREEQRKKDVADWDQQVSQGSKPQDTRRTGKTARQKAKGKAGADVHTRKKRAQSARSKEVRGQMQGRK